jgi:hypothetical protein
MKHLFPLVLAASSLAPFAHAAEVCQQVSIDLIFKNPEYPIHEPARNPFDLEGKTTEAIQRAGLQGTLDLLSCQAATPLCLKSQNGNWSLLTQSGPDTLTAETTRSGLQLTRITHHRSGGDPWYGIGASSWTRELRLTLNLESLSIKSLLIDGADTTLGISKRTRGEGQCRRIAVESIRKSLSERMKKETFLAMTGSGPSSGSPIEANFLLSSKGSLLQITAIHPDSGEVELLDLESEESLGRLPIEAIAALQPVNAMAILRDMKRNHSRTGPAPDGSSLRKLRCIQGANALLESGAGRQADIRYRGYTRIELSPASTGPGSDLGYRPLSRMRVVRAGWEGSFRPATLPFGKLEATAVIDDSGNAAFIAPGPSGIQSRPILRMEARTAKERHGLQADLVAFEDTLCFAR